MWWLLLLIPLLLIVFLLFLKIRLCIVYTGELTVKAKILFLSFSLYPSKKEKIDPNDYTVKALRKKQKKLDKKAKKQQKKQQPKEKAEAEQPQEKGAKLKEMLEIIKIVLENVMSPFGKYLRIVIARIHIKVGTDDPAKTALLYGGVCQGVSCIVELLSNLTNVNVKRKNSIDVTPDFVEGKTDADINITLSLRVWHILSLAIKFFMGYIKKKQSLPSSQKAQKNHKYVK